MEPGKMKTLLFDEVVKMPFPKKLWVVCCSVNHWFMRWNSKGKYIIIRMKEFQAYLHTRKSVFKYQTFRSFLRLLSGYGFKEKRHIPADVNLLEVYHPFFKRDRRELLRHMKQRPKKNKRLHSAGEELEYFNGCYFEIPIEKKRIILQEDNNETEC